MALEDLNVVRRVFDAVGQGDSAAVLALYDANVEFDASATPAGELEGRVYHGHDGLRAWSRHWRDAWDGYEDEVHELIDAGDRIVSVVTVRGRGRTSGIEVEFPKNAGLWTIRDGRVVHVRWYPTRAEALAAAGAAASVRGATVDLVRSIHDLWARGDMSTVDWADPEIETVLADGPSPGSWTGLSGMSSGWGEFFRAWHDFRGVGEQFIGLDSERVLGIVRWVGRGRTSGLEIGGLEARGANLLHVKHGQVTRLVTYLDADRALADLGLGS